MKYKVLIIGLTAGIGGVETYICNLDKFIDREKFEITYLVHEKINDKYLNQLDNNQNKIVTVTGVKKNPIKFFKDVISFYKNNKFDIIYLNECTSEFILYCFPVLFNKNVNFVVHSHNGSGKNKLLHGFLKFFQNLRVNKKWACSEIAYDWMFNPNDKNKTVIHNGIELEKFKYNELVREQKRKELKINDKFVIGNIARFDIQKNHLFMVKIFSEYLKVNKDAVLVLIGNGLEKEKTINLVKDLDIEKNVLFLGNRNDIPEVLMAFDIFFLPSLFEGLPFVTIEAQATGLPILVSNNVSEELDLTDIVYRENLDSAAEAWIKKIEQIRNMHERKNISTKCQEQLIEKKYNIQDTIKFVENEFCNMCKNKEE